MYTIGEFSRLCQVPIKTLRYYDGLGLLRPKSVNRSTGYRYYEPAQLERLNRILVLKDLGFALHEIGELLAGNVPPNQLRALLREKRDDLERRVGRERARLARVTARLDVLDQCHGPATHDVAVRHVGARLVASLRRALPAYDACDGLFAELEHRLGDDVAIDGRAAVWHHGAATIDCEAAIFLSESIAPIPGVAVYEMPAHTAACLVYRGDGDGAAAFTALYEWIASTGVTTVGAKREVYLDEGGRGEPVTEIQYPIAAIMEECDD